jgi:DNA-binding CsgD family transcriptional regulator
LLHEQSRGSRSVLQRRRREKALAFTERVSTAEMHYPDRMLVDPLDVIERAYDVESSEEDWLRGVLESAAPAIDAGRGLLAYLYDAAARPLRAWNFVGNFAPTHGEVIDVITAADDEYVAQSYLVIPFGTASEQPGFERQRTFGRQLHKYGIKDALAINAFDRSGLGAWIGALLPEKATVSASERERWAKVSMHIAAALRLRHRLQTVDAVSQARPRAEAILTADGKLEHAEAEATGARQALGEAVRRLDRARGHLRKSAPSEALDEWRVLVRARWSLVDQFDSDGRRFILAYQNLVSSDAPSVLSAREHEVLALAAIGCSPKLVAYQLGLSASTVRVHLTNASRKLGVHTRAALIEKFRQLLLRASSDPGASPE